MKRTGSLVTLFACASLFFGCPGGSGGGDSDTGGPDDTGPGDTAEMDVADGRDTEDVSDATDAEDDATVDADATPDGRGDTPSPDGDATGDVDAATDGDAPTTERFGPGMIVESAALDPECCRSLDDDSEVDNALGSTLLDFADNFDDSELNTDLNNALQNNQIVKLFELRDVESITSDDAIEMFTHPGQDATPDDSSDDFVDEGSPYLIDPSSFGDDGQPRYPFGSAEIQDSNQVVAEASEVPFTAPLINSRQVTVTVEDVRLTGDLTEPASLESGGYVNLENGELSGVVSKDELFQSVNDLASRACSCLGGDPLFTEESEDQWACNDPPDACSGQSGVAYMCDPDACSTLVSPILNDNADLNRNASTANDHYSVGATFSAAGASIQGVADSE